MKEIIVGLSKPPEFKPFAYAIQKFEGTEYSHAYIKFHCDQFDRDMIYQASGLAVNFMSSDVFSSHGTPVHEWKIQVTDEQFNEIMKFCADQLGKPYGLKAIIGIAFYIPFGIKLVDSDKLETFICSELVGEILKIIDIIDKDAQLDYFTPKDVFNTLDKRSDIIKL